MIPVSFCLVVGKYEVSFSFGETELQFVEELEPTSVGGDYEIVEYEDEDLAIGFGRPGEIKGKR